MTAYVFLGPSLPVAQASRLLDAVYLPPIQQGDLLRLLDRNPSHVGIVDGYFETVPAVWHKEILSAMSRGVHVFGAASMGALRAAELHSLGMVGVGTIFAWYRDGRITADDEVAVQHGPAELGYLPLSEALVDIRDSCAAALRAGVISEAFADRAIVAARRLPYWERSHAAVAARLSEGGDDEGTASEWLSYVKAQVTSLKARDTTALLSEMKKHMGDPSGTKTIDVSVERTIFIEQLINDIALENAQASGSSATAGEAREGRTSDDLRTRTLLRIVARQAAEQFGWEIYEDEISDARNALRFRLGLDDQRSFQLWMTSHAITEPLLRAYIRDALFIDRLMRQHDDEIDRLLPDQVRIERAQRSG